MGDTVPTGDGWPADYTVPELSGQGGDATTPGGKATEPAAQADGQPEGAAPVATGGDQGGQGDDPEEYFERFPKRRLAEIVQQRNQFEAAARTLQGVVEKVLGRQPAVPGQPAAGQPAEPEDPKVAQIRERLFQVMPWLKDLQEKLYPKLESVIGAADNLPAQQQQTEQYWNAVASHTVQRLWSGAAVALLGEGKTARDLAPAALKRLHADFSVWCSQDPERTKRYESIDPKLVDDFLAELKAAYVDPLRRSAVAPAVARARTVQRLPRAGGGIPVGTAKPKLDLQNEDAVHDAGWKALQEAIGQSR